MQSKAHMEKPQQNSICVSRVSTRNFYLYCISLYGALLNDQQHMQNRARIQKLHEKIWTSCSTSIFIFFLTFPTRARGVGRCWSHFWVQLTLNYSMTIPTRARADSRNPFLHVFDNKKWFCQHPFFSSFWYFRPARAGSDGADHISEYN